MAVVRCPVCARELPAGARCPEHGAQAVPPTAIHSSGKLPSAAGALTGTTLGEYQVGALLGSGATSDVYAAELPLLGRKAALKVLKAGVEPELAGRMLAEARAVNAIRHPNIVEVDDAGTLPDGRPYLVMEWLDGEALDAMLARRGALPPLEAVEVLEGVCAALAAAHAKGIVHRDVKPANVVVGSADATHARRVKLLDFGLARSLDGPRRTRVGMVLGTPDYLAPELAVGEAPTPRSDLYALGVMAFELLTGQLPFRGASASEVLGEHLSGPVPVLSSRLTDTPAALEALVRRLMAKVPAERPDSARTVLRELEGVARELRQAGTRVDAQRPTSVALPATRLVPQLEQGQTPPPAATPAEPPAPASEEKPGSRWIAPLLALVGCGLFALALLWTREDTPPPAPPHPPTPIAHAPVAVQPAPEPAPAPLSPPRPPTPARHPKPTSSPRATRGSNTGSGSSFPTYGLDGFAMQRIALEQRIEDDVEALLLANPTGWGDLKWRLDDLEAQAKQATSPAALERIAGRLEALEQDHPEIVPKP